MADVYAARRDRLRSLLAERDLQGALITRLVNVYYLTGFTGSAAALLVTDQGAVLAKNSRYAYNNTKATPDLECLIDQDCVPALAQRAVQQAVRRLAFEEHDVTVELHGALMAAAGEVPLAPLSRAVEQLRQVKDETEITVLRQACAISSRALSELMESILIDRSERHIAAELERRMMDHGSHGVAFETIVASGPNSAYPQHRSGERCVEEGDFLIINCGARYQGYSATVTRTFVVGADPADWQIEIYDLVFAAQKAGREALVSGTPGREVDAVARMMISDAGYGDYFPHDLGHGVGLEISEGPYLGKSAEGTLAAGACVTVKPGIYLPGRGGVRIEDTLVVRELADDRPELLTMTTKELLVL